AVAWSGMVDASRRSGELRDGIRSTERAKLVVLDFDDIIAGFVLVILEDVAHVVDGTDDGVGRLHLRNRPLGRALTCPFFDKRVEFGGVVHTVVVRRKLWVVDAVGSVDSVHDVLEDGLRRRRERNVTVSRLVNASRG